MVTPTLRDWDNKFKEQLQQVQSQYEPYKPFLDNQVPPEALEQAYGLYNLINENPELVFKQMQEFYGFGDQGQAAGSENEGEEETFDFNSPEADITQHPKFQELLQNQQMLAQVLVQKDEQERYGQITNEIETELAGIKEKSPDIDELMLFQLAVGAGITLTQAAEQLGNFTEHVRTESRRPAPNVFSGGGVPAQQIPDPAKMSDKETKQTVAAILAAQAQANKEP
jgi:cell division protein ZapA (FtsZ GTPase activity inhibitor)